MFALKLAELFAGVEWQAAGACRSDLLPLGGQLVGHRLEPLA